LSFLPKLSPERQARIAGFSAGAFCSHAIAALLIFNAFLARDLYRITFETLCVFVFLPAVYAALCFVIALPIVRGWLGPAPMITPFRFKVAFFIVVLLIPHIVR
jgi:hypothetical protein